MERPNAAADTGVRNDWGQTAREMAQIGGRHEIEICFLTWPNEELASWPPSLLGRRLERLVTR